MATNRTRLELTWIGKNEHPRLEPRILLEDPKLSYSAPHRVTESDIFDNRLIFGDNLLALKALEQEFAGKIRCIYIDPPFNTGQAFDLYEDGLEHSEWLTLMRDRLDMLKALLAQNGSIFVHVDDTELAHLVLVMDEVFGRANRINIVTFKQGSATGHKAINPGLVTTSNFIVIYARERALWKFNRVFTERTRDRRYDQFIINRSDQVKDWKFEPLTRAFESAKGLPEGTLRRRAGEYEDALDQFVLDYADNIFQFARPNYAAVSGAARRAIDFSTQDSSKVVRFERSGYSDMYLLGGRRLLFYSDKLKAVDGRYVAGEPLTTIWADVLSNNLHNEGGVEFPKGKKPEALVKRIIELATEPGDLVLDSFAGSGTTGAVAHKMNRCWIMVELREHAHTHIIPRMKRVIDGTDQGGITKAVDWKGGGGFRYSRLAPSLLEKDRWGNWVVSQQYNAAMLSEAMCKLEGFTYAPSDSVYWQQGYSTERDCIYVTTQTLTHEQLAALNDEVGESRSLLVCCGAFRGNPDHFPNLTLKKIPNAVLKKCEWGRDDYSLKVSQLAQAPTSQPESSKQTANGRVRRSTLAEGQLLLEQAEKA